MQAHAIVVIEEGALNVLVGHRRGADVVVARSVRLPLADLSRGAVETAVRGIGSDMLLGAPGVHVVIGERRVFHQLATLPKLGAKDALDFVTREALRHSNIASRDELLLQTRLVRRLPAGKLEVGVVAFSRALWGPVAEAFEAQHLQVLSLQTVETCLAMAPEAAGPEPVAMLECNGNRARFLLCRDGVPMQVRRFLISGGSSDNEMALATQLTMELPRTLDWLRESGQPAPKRLVIGTRVGLGDESLQMLAIDDDTEVARCRLPVVVEEGQAAPDIGVATLLHRLATGGAVRSLLDAPRLRLPAGPGMLVGGLAAAALMFVGGYSAVIDGSAWLRQRAAQRDLASQVQDLEQELLRHAAGEEEVDTAAPTELLTALCMRRPCSRMLAEVSNATDQQVHIEELRFASKSPVVLVGTVEGATRQEALAAMAGFHRRIDALPFLKATDQEEINETPTGYRFKLSLAWRNR